jgi:hypothetical protein
MQVTGIRKINTVELPEELKNVLKNLDSSWGKLSYAGKI